MIPEILIFLLTFIALLFWYVNQRPLNTPPVPRISFPVLGHFPYFEKYQKVGTSKLFMEWSAKCKSSIISVDFAAHRTVVLNSAQAIKQAFALLPLSGRMIARVNTLRAGDDGVTRGLIFSFGTKWIEQRRFSLRHLKEFGFGRKSMEGIIMTEAEDLVKEFKRDAGIPISTTTRFNAAVVNSFWQICAGERFSHDDPKLAELVAAIIQNIQGTKVLGVVIFMEWFWKLFPKLGGWADYERNFHLMNNYLKRYVEDRIAKHDAGASNDFIDVYIEEMKNCTDPTSSFYKDEGKKNLLNALGDIFAAGSETTSTTMSWISLYLAKYPKIQDEVHAEIDRVIGQERLPTLADRDRMPYVEAVLEETLRMSSVVVLGVFHEAMEDTTLAGFLIPKSTVVIANIYGANHDPEVWGPDADEFQPSRFLSNDKTKFSRNENMIAFSTGRRLCLGEALARNELFLFTTTILQKFRIETNPNAQAPSLTPNFGGIVAGPLPHTLLFSERH